MAEAAPVESALSLLLHALSMAAGGASAQPAAGDASESEPSLLLHALAGDPLRAIVQLLGDADLPCFRLVCRTFRDHSSPAQKKCRGDFLRTRALTVFAWERMPGFVADGGLLRLALFRRFNKDLPRMLRLAASVGCVDVLEELVDNRGCELTVGECAAAAGEGHLDALTWLHSRGCPWDFQTCWLAAAGGHLEVLRYAHEHGCPWDSNICWSAAARGHLEVLRYAHERGCPWDSRTCSLAALGGHLEILRYAHEHGCPWSSGTCYKAAQGGHLEILQYAHEHGCPWGSGTCHVAAEGGHFEVLRYAHEHGCPLDREWCLEQALHFGHAEVAEYVRAAGTAA
jgi:hypothetical protein